MLKSSALVNRFHGPPTCFILPAALHGRTMITVTLGSQKQPVTYPNIKTVLQLLHKLNLRGNDALIIRDGELLTPDRHLHDGDHITVRPVTSRG